MLIQSYIFISLILCDTYYVSTQFINQREYNKKCIIKIENLKKVQLRTKQIFNDKINHLTFNNNGTINN